MSTLIPQTTIQSKPSYINAEKGFSGFDFKKGQIYKNDNRLWEVLADGAQPIPSPNYKLKSVWIKSLKDSGISIDPIEFAKKNNVTIIDD